jgi:hypothetical protein
MVENDGVASIQCLYRDARRFRELPSGDWQKTLRGVLYREVNRGRFRKIGLGVYALATYENDASAYSYALKNRNVEEYLKTTKDYHSTAGVMLQSFSDKTTLPKC